MSTIETQYIQQTIDYIRKCVAEQRADEARHKANFNLTMANWYEGRADAFEDIARWLERDIRFFATKSDEAA